jgi:phage shock protein E
MGIFSSFFGSNKNKVQDFIDRKAVILDVRSKQEYDSGAIPGSKLIPLPELTSRISEVKAWKKPVITCCASGVRSSSAAGILRNNGIEAVNGGGWASLQHKL